MILFLAVVAFSIALYVTIEYKLPILNVIFLIIAPPILLSLYTLIENIILGYTENAFAASFITLLFSGMYMLPALFIFGPAIVILKIEYKLSCIKIATLSAIVALFVSLAYFELYITTVSIITGTLSALLLYCVKWNSLLNLIIRDSK